jgi:hypothetical protein
VVVRGGATALLARLIAATAGNYNAPDAWKLPVAVIAEVVFAALKPR